MKRKIISIAIIVTCGLIFTIAHLKRVVGSFEPKDEVIELTYNAQLRKAPGCDFYSLHNTATGRKESELKFNGTYEALDLAAVEDSKELFILYSSGKKYLLDARAGHSEIILGGDPFISYEKDNEGGICFRMDDGLFPMDKTEGLPSRVDSYYRSGRAFFYCKGGKWGVYHKLVESSSVFGKPKYCYVEILPAEFDRIRFVNGDGACHFIARKGGKWQIYDGWGRVRYMCSDGYNKHHLNTYSRSAAGEDNVSGYYIKQILSIPVDTKEKYIPYLSTKCTYTGGEEAGAINLERHDTRYDSFFLWQRDESTIDLPWDNGEKSDLYHY